MLAVAAEEEHRARALGAICSTQGSSALSTAVPVGWTTSTIVRLTSASFSSVSIPAIPRWSPSPMFGHHGDVALIEAEPFAEDPPSGRLEDRRLDLGIEQDRPGGLRATAITGLDPTAIHIDPVAVGHADGLAGAAEDMSDQPSGRRLAVDAGHGDQRNPAVILFREHHIDDRFTDRAGSPRRRLEVHPQSRTGVHLDDHPLALRADG